MRDSGILLPIFSLPDKYGAGTFSDSAMRFIDFLSDCGLKYWQILPLSPIGDGYSPYQSSSTFAIEPLFIDLKDLIDKYLLTEDECKVCLGFDENYVDYQNLIPAKMSLLCTAYDRFTPDKKYKAFIKKESFWLDDFAIFMDSQNPDYHKFLQYMAFTQWDKVKKYANDKGIGIIGDLPIYVSPVGADINGDKELFQLDDNGEIVNIAGCPGDDFAPKGQLWNNPLYNWEYHEQTGYSWWILRMKKALELFDVVRLDHFRGFDEYFSIPKGDEDASRGVWMPGPGIKLFKAFEESLGQIQVIAEDLGFINQSVRDLRQECGYPGMKVLQFGFDGNPNNEYNPVNYEENSIAYTGTHDNQTLIEWLETVPIDVINQIKRLLALEEHANFDNRFLAENLIKFVCSSNSKTCIVPIQDFMFLGKEGRINTPSTLGGYNWRWRMNQSVFEDDQLKSLIKSILQSTARYWNH